MGDLVQLPWTEPPPAAMPAPPCEWCREGDGVESVQVTPPKHRGRTRMLQPHERATVVLVCTECAARLERQIVRAEQEQARRKVAAR